MLLQRMVVTKIVELWPWYYDLQLENMVQSIDCCIGEGGISMFWPSTIINYDLWLQNLVHKLLFGSTEECFLCMLFFCFIAQKTFESYQMALWQRNWLRLPVAILPTTPLSTTSHCCFWFWDYFQLVALSCMMYHACAWHSDTIVQPKLQ